MNTFTNPFLSAVPAFEFRIDYQKCSFWCDNHPLSPVYDVIAKDIPDMDESDNPTVEVARLATNCYYDLYNNGGGNSGRWAIRRALKTALKGFDDNAKAAILKSHKDLTDAMTGNWFPKGNETVAYRAMEVFMTNVVYAISQMDDKYKTTLPRAE